MKSAKIDKIFLASVVVLALGGFFIFTSASLGLLATQGSIFGSTTLSQFVSLVIGVILFYVVSRIPYKFWKKNAMYLFVAAVLVNLLLFIPAITLQSGGAGRWINLHFITFQPSEFLKIAFII